MHQVFPWPGQLFHRGWQAARRWFRDRRHRVRTVHVDNIVSQSLQNIRKEPAAIVATFQESRDIFRRLIGAPAREMSEHELQAVYCMILAHGAAPWGGSTCTRFPDMLHSETLNCGSYGLLTHYLLQFFPAPGESALRVVGWDGPTIGNHQMLFLDRLDPPGSLLLDPTVGLMVRVGFDEVASGVSCPSRRMLFLHVREELTGFKKALVEALRRGKFRPSELLYYFDGFDHLLQRYNHPRDWPTPGAIHWRTRELR